MEKKIENMTKKELIERINELQINYDSIHKQYTQFGIRAAKDMEDLKKKVYEAATAREDDFNILKEKNEAIHEEAKRWKKEAVEAQAELDDLRSAIDADDSDPISVAIWKAKYHTLKFKFDKLKDEDRKWASANPAVQAALEKEINKLKAESSDWEAKYEYQKGQTDCVVSDYNKLNKKYENLCFDYAALSRHHDDLSAKYSNDVGRVTYLEERNKDLIKQCDELYDRNKELDAENSYLTDEVDNLKKTLKKTVNKMYGISSSIPDITDTADFEDRARRCAIIFSRTIDDMINAYNTDINSFYDGSIVGVAKTVNTIRGGKLWLDSLEETMRKFSEEAEKYIKKVGEKND